MTEYKSVLIDINKWFICVKELSGSETDLFFNELISIHNGNMPNYTLPYDVLNSIKFSDGIISCNKAQEKDSHWNWKGGISNENNIVRSSAEYKKWRVSVFLRDKHTCRKCNKKGGTLNAHHIEPFSINKDLRLSIDNGLTLCKNCHVELHKTNRQWL